LLFNENKFLLILIIYLTYKVEKKEEKSIKIAANEETSKRFLLIISFC